MCLTEIVRFREREIKCVSALVTVLFLACPFNPASYVFFSCSLAMMMKPRGHLALPAMEETIYKVGRPVVDVPEACANYTPL